MLRTRFTLAGILALAVAATSMTGAAPDTDTPMIGPSFSSIGPLAFGPEGVLYAGDRQAATIVAIELGAQAMSDQAGTADVAGIEQKIASMLGTDAREIAITDLAVHPTTRNAYLSVMRGQGAGAQPVLLRVDGAGDIAMIDLDELAFTSVALPNPVDASPNSRRTRADAITDMAFVDGRLYVSGLSNEEFSSKFWSVPYPFRTAEPGTSVEIYHGNHGRYETNSPVYSFVPTRVNGEPSLIAGYLCTPLVRFPVGDLQPGGKVMGTTIAELGNRNRPIDMVIYRKDGREFVLMSNTSRGVMKIPTQNFGAAAGITAPVEDKAGVSYTTIESMQNIEQLDLLNATHSIVLTRTESGALNLRAVPLP